MGTFLTKIYLKDYLLVTFLDINTNSRKYVNLRQNSGEMEDFSIQVGKITHNKNEDWLDHSNVFCEPVKK